MFHGDIVEMGKTADVLFQPQSDYTRTLLAAVPAVDAAEEARHTAERAAHG